MEEENVIALIRQFGQWLKQGFGWLIDVFVTICSWGISQVEALLNIRLTISPTLPDLIPLLVILILLLIVAWLLRNVWYRIRAMISVVIDAIGMLIMALVGVTTFFGSIGAVCFIVLWATGHTNFASLR